MMKTLLRSSVGLLLTLLFLSPVRAQEEPEYRFSQTGNKTMLLSVRVSPGKQGCETIELRDASSHVPRGSGGDTTVTHGVNVSLQTEPEHVPSVCVVSDGPLHRPDQWVMVQAVLSAGGEGSSAPPTYEINAPSREGTLSFAGTLLTTDTLKGVVGRVYDWRKGGRQVFVLLSDYPATTPVITTLFLSAEKAKAEPIEVGGVPVQARRLHYEAVLPHLAPSDTQGVLYIGSFGEVLRCDTRLLGMPFQVSAVPTPNPSGRGGYTLKIAVPPIKTIVEEQGSGAVVRQVFKDDFPISTSWTNARFSLVRREAFMGQHRVFDTDGSGRLRYRAELSRPRREMCVSNYPFFFPQWFVTQGWENKLAAGEPFDVDYFPLLDGNPNGYYATVERLRDIEVVHGGKSAALHHYRFTFWAGKDKAKAGGLYEVYTDGKRLVAALGSDGVQILRQNWDDVTKGFTLPLPPTPKPAAP